MNKLELRFKPVDLTTVTDGDDLRVEGYVNLTEQTSEIMSTYSGHRFIEKISKGAFSKALRRATEIDFLVEHDKERILSTTRNNSLNLVEDDKGLFMSATISATSWGKDYYTLIKDGIIENFSFGFKALTDKWEERADGLLERTVYDMDLFEVSLVKNPAYTQSYVEARSSDYLSTEDTYKRGERMSAEEKVEIEEEVEEIEEEHISSAEELKKLADSFQELVRELQEKQLLLDDDKEEEKETDGEDEEETLEEEEKEEEERALPEDVQESEDEKDESNLKTTILGLEMKIEKVYSMLEEVLNDKNREINEEEEKEEEEIKEDKEEKKQEKKEKQESEAKENTNLAKLKETLADLDEYTE